jgi:hypothetical protein
MSIAMRSCVCDRTHSMILGENALHLMKDYLETYLRVMTLDKLADKNLFGIYYRHYMVNIV